MPAAISKSVNNNPHSKGAPKGSANRGGDNPSKKPTPPPKDQPLQRADSNADSGGEMPPPKSASTEPQGAYDPAKEIYSLFEKKQRNLSKRKTKLDGYLEEQKKGKKLDEDQVKAVKKYELVTESLDLLADLKKNIEKVFLDYNRIKKKDARRENLERFHKEKERLRQILTYQNVLRQLRTEPTGTDFKNGRNGAQLLDPLQVSQLETLCDKVSITRGKFGEPFEAQVNSAADILISLAEGKNKESPVPEASYVKLKQLLTDINSSPYFASAEGTPGAIRLTDQAEIKSETTEAIVVDTQIAPSDHPAPGAFNSQYAEPAGAIAHSDPAIVTAFGHTIPSQTFHPRNGGQYMGAGVSPQVAAHPPPMSVQPNVSLEDNTRHLSNLHISGDGQFGQGGKVISEQTEKNPAHYVNDNVNENGQRGENVGRGGGYRGSRGGFKGERRGGQRPVGERRDNREHREPREHRDYPREHRDHPREPREPREPRDHPREPRDQPREPRDQPRGMRENRGRYQQRSGPRENRGGFANGSGNRGGGGGGGGSGYRGNSQPQNAPA